MAGIARRDHRGTLLDAFGWPWWDDGRTLAQRLAGLRDEMVRVEELTEEGVHIVRAELPGIDPDRDVEITVTDGVLAVRAERHEEQKEEKAGGVFRTEFRYGSFYRAVPLPTGAKEDEISATYKDGILEIRVPVDPNQEKASARNVEIKRA
jgi:HSP20 family protein